MVCRNRKCRDGRKGATEARNWALKTLASMPRPGRLGCYALQLAEAQGLLPIIEGMREKEAGRKFKLEQLTEVDGDPIPDRPLKRQKTPPKIVEEAEGIQKIECVPLKQGRKFKLEQLTEVDGDLIPDRPLKRAKTSPKIVEEAEGIQKIECVPLKQEAIDDASKRCFARSQPTGCEKRVRCKEEPSPEAFPTLKRKRVKTEPLQEEFPALVKVKTEPSPEAFPTLKRKRVKTEPSPEACPTFKKVKREAETDAGTLARMPHHTMAAPESVLRKCGQNYPPRRVQHDGDNVQVTVVESFKKYQRLWWQVGLVSCDRCERLTPRHAGEMQGAPGRSQYAQFEFLCPRCLA